MSITHTTGKQDQEFVKRLVNEISLDATFVIGWVVENFDPGDVYTLDQLEDWEIDHGFVNPEEEATK
jgi:hypothetical protein